MLHEFVVIDIAELQWNYIEHFGKLALDVFPFCRGDVRAAMGTLRASIAHLHISAPN